VTPDQQTLVQTSFAKLAPIADTAAGLFYDELFQRDPALHSLFKPDMAEQRRKLMAMLATAVAHVGDWGTISAAVAALGQRHVAYGVKPADYETVGAALMATLAKGLGEDFTPPVRDAWAACIAKVAGEMLSAATPATP
jgi:nitric oxide dioxygenase